jgi:hypothetical protein
VGINVTGSSASATIAGLLTNVDQEQFHHQAVLQTGYNLFLGIIIIQVLMLTHLRSYQDGTGGSDNLVTF